MNGVSALRRPVANGFGVCLAVLAAGGCALGTAPFATPVATDLPALEAQANADPTDIDVLTRLAAGYVVDGRVDEALAVLERGIEALPDDPTLLLMLGLVEAELELEDRAATRFATYIAAVDGPLSADTRARLDAVLGSALGAEAAGRLAAEEGSGAWDTDPMRVVVLPLNAAAEDRALATGLSWLLARELESARFRVEDRRRVRAYLAARGATVDELSELSTGIDMARLFDARHVVQGRLSRSESDAVRWDLTVLSILPNGTVVLAPLPIESSSVDVMRAAGAASAAARRAIEGRGYELALPDAAPTPPDNVEALSAFGRGLLAVDANTWESALEKFEVARALDPGFEDATRWARRSEAVARIEREPLLTSLEVAARHGERERAVVAVRRDPRSTRAEALDRLSSRHRADVPELLGLDQLLSGALLSLVLETAGPGGEP